jgi:hypothetical protein
MQVPGSSTASSRVTHLASWTLSACAVHCAIMPFAVGVLPLIGLGFFASEWFEWSMVGVAAALGGAGLGLSYARAHRNARPLALFLVGLGVIVSGHLALRQQDVMHAVLALCGAGLMFVAGRMNHDCSKHAAH